MTYLNHIGFSGIKGTIIKKDGQILKLEEIKPELIEPGSTLDTKHLTRELTEALKGYNSIRFTTVDKGSGVILDDSALETENIVFDKVDNASIYLKGNSVAKINGTVKESQVSIEDKSKLKIQTSLDSKISQSGGNLSIENLNSNYPVPEYDKKHQIKPYVYKEPVSDKTIKREGLETVESELKQAQKEVKEDREFAKGKLNEYLSSYSSVVISGDTVTKIKNANNGTKIHHFNENADLTITNLEKGSKLIATARYSENHVDVKKLINSLTDKEFKESISELSKREARHTISKLTNDEAEQLVDKMVQTRLTKIEDHKQVNIPKSKISISQEEARIIIKLNNLDFETFADGMSDEEAAEYRKDHVVNNNGGEIISNSKYGYRQLGNLYDDERDNADSNFFDYRGKRDAIHEDAYNLEPFTNKRDFKEKYGKKY